jgi:2-C-methyl-D-erythritol 4-phosphate cytidylyltransferase
VICAIVVAAGSGSRFGGLKQFEVVRGRTLTDWSVAAARSVADDVTVVVPADLDVTQLPGDLLADRLVPGGATRAESVRAGLTALPVNATIVVVHDAARAAATSALFHRVVDAVRAGAEAAICAVPVTDTVKSIRREGEATLVEHTLDRTTLVAVQTPQAFTYATLLAAHAAGLDATDDAGLVEALGIPVVVVEGEPTNVKVTAPSDLATVAQVLT